MATYVVNSGGQLVETHMNEDEYKAYASRYSWVLKTMLLLVVALVAALCFGIVYTALYFMNYL